MCAGLQWVSEKTVSVHAFRQVEGDIEVAAFVVPKPVLSFVLPFWGSSILFHLPAIHLLVLRDTTCRVPSKVSAALTIYFRLHLPHIYRACDGMKVVCTLLGLIVLVPALCL